MSRDKNPRSRNLPNRLKVPRSPIPETRKSPTSQAVPSLQGKSPRWRFCMLDLDGPFSWRQITADELSAVHARLTCFESMSWMQVLKEGSRRNHWIARNRLSPEADKRLREIGLDDVDHLMSMGIDGCRRVHGILDQDTLKLLWWDPNHQVCLSPKRNT
jgi:hypothetical protein